MFETSLFASLYSPTKFKNKLRTIEVENSKNLRTASLDPKITGSYKECIKTENHSQSTQNGVDN